jgi:hypothetical protein
MIVWRRTVAMAAAMLGATAVIAAAPRINRHALVERHAITFTAIDPHAPVMLGNGELGFTADITGLQTFPERYAPQAPLLTMAQWAWHSFPNPNGYTAKDGEVQVPVPARGTQPFAYIRDLAKQDPAVAWLRENPHRFSLGRVSLAMRHADGRAVRFEELRATTQHLDLWTGTLVSRFVLDGEPVSVTTRVGWPQDAVLVEIASPLVATGRIGIDVTFPGVSHDLNPDPSDWTHPDTHATTLLNRGRGRIAVRNRIDATRYGVTVRSPGATVTLADVHRIAIRHARTPRLIAAIGFASGDGAPALIDQQVATVAADRHWREYWTRGAAIDLSGTADPRAAELERRIVLSQYLAAINEAGTVPPQEEGLFSNSWNGKFHLEMHAWHSAHFALWGRPELLERSLAWYRDHLPQALAQGRRHGLDAAWWPKMAGPEGRNSPSPINPFIFWQQPHPIYLAEAIFRARPTRATLDRYAGVVEATARLLAGWPRLDPSTGHYHLGPPIVPVQENHDPFTTVDPAFELEYVRWGLQVAQTWRARRGLPRDAGWDRVIAGIAPMPTQGGLYVPVASEPDFWARSGSPACRGDAQGGCANRDHPSFLMSYGLIGSDRVDPATMRRTLAATAAIWDWRRVWGWDFPMIAMTAARLGDGDGAVDWLLRDAPNNAWGPTGMTPRFDVADGGRGPLVRRADTYFPSNGALLLATGMMASGWTGSSGPAPGFPQHWTVRAEGFAGGHR